MPEMYRYRARLPQPGEGGAGRQVLDDAGRAAVPVQQHDAVDGARERLRRAGFSDRDIWDISAIAGFFNMSNRIASATDMRPNSVYHATAR